MLGVSGAGKDFYILVTFKTLVPISFRVLIVFLPLNPIRCLYTFINSLAEYISRCFVLFAIKL